ncbi:MAG: hypothetical protein A2428_16295 [Bdellovibrionales bacterium RIFOXYC1_FULL_54_43]|nr:MAG: hypothetical protein A2428_16295 [Bdellovibrionales bacterium RIFOXYC1_FULL_54_43]OFZ83973.1 MAG: hypothetical protein A2603_10500 [Bdellovibrionales bacterium RIFOXYD1_FULL_55_31]
MSRKGILSASLIYVPSQIVVMLTAIVRGFVLPKILLPESYGMLAIVFLVVNYSRMANLGVLNEYDREYPRALSTSSPDEQKSYRDTCFTLFFSHNLIYSLALGGYYAWKHPGQSSWLWSIFFGLLLLDNVNEFVVDTCRAHRQFFEIAKNRIILNLLSVGLSVWGALKFGLHGAIGGIGLGYFLGIYFFLRMEDRPRLRIQRSLLRSIYSSSFSLLAVLGLSMLLDSYDRLIVARFFSAAEMGVYALAHSMARLVLFVFVSVNYVFYPFLLSMHAQEKDLQRLRSFYSKVCDLIAVAVPLLLMAMYFFLNAVVPAYLPRYEASLVILPVLLGGMFFLILSQMTETFLLVLNKQGAVIRNQVTQAVLLGALLVGLYFAGRDLRWVASLFILGNATYFFMIRQTLAYELGREITRGAGALLGSALFVVSAGVFAMFLKPWQGHEMLWSNVMGLGAVGLVSFVALFWIDARTGLVREAIGVVRSKFS